MSIDSRGFRTLTAGFELSQVSGSAHKRGGRARLERAHFCNRGLGDARRCAVSKANFFNCSHADATRSGATPSPPLGRNKMCAHAGPNGERARSAWRCLVTQQICVTKCTSPQLRARTWTLPRRSTSGLPRGGDPLCPSSRSAAWAGSYWTAMVRRYLRSFARSRE